MLGRFNGPTTIAPDQVAPRNALQGLPLHRIDVRFSKDINLPGSTKVTGIVEVFNLTNHANFGAYNGQLNSTTFGQPRQSLLNADQPRVMQLAVKFSFYQGLATADAEKRFSVSAVANVTSASSAAGPS